MKTTHRPWYAAYAIAALGLVLGTYGLAFAGASKQGCTTRWRQMFTPPHNVIWCGGTCPDQTNCHPINLTNGLTICGCENTDPNAHYDPVGEGAATKCVTTIHAPDPEMWAMPCQQGSCKKDCVYKVDPIYSPDPPYHHGNETWCECPPGG